MKSSKRLMIVLLIIMSLVPNTLKAEKNLYPKCEEVLSACDKALKDQIKLNHKRNEIIQEQENHLLTQREKIDQLKRENNSLLKNPWFWFGVGLVGGVVLTK